MAEVVFCARAWHLRASGRGATANAEARAAGRRVHTAHAASSVRIERIDLLSRVFLMLAMLVGVAAAATWLLGLGQ